MHGVDDAISAGGGPFRAGYVTMDEELKSSLDYLYDRYESNASTPDGIYWLAAGYVATGQIGLARDLIADARRNHVDDPRIANLEGLIAFLEGDPERAEALLRSISRTHPSDAVPAINLAVVLREQGKFQEASRVLTDVANRFDGTPFAARARILLDGLHMPESTE